jgi:hypothetical protein
LLREIAEDQWGVVSRQALLEGGITQAQLVGQVAAQRWRQLNEAVVVLHNGPLPREQKEMAVMLSAPKPAALDGVTAMAGWGIRGFTSPVVHVVVQRGAKVLPLPGIDVHVHESRRFVEADIAVLRQPRRVSAARALVDAAAWSRWPRDAARILVSGVQQRVTNSAQLRAELVRAGAVRHRRMLTLLLNDLDGGAQALSEVEFLRFCRRHGFPRPTLNYRVDARGRRRYLDALFTGPDGRTKRIEIDGGIHLTLGQRWLDDMRDNDLVLSGNGHGLRFPSVAVYTDDAEAVRQLRAFLFGSSR